MIYISNVNFNKLIFYFILFFFFFENRWPQITVSLDVISIFKALFGRKLHKYHQLVHGLTATVHMYNTVFTTAALTLQYY